MTLFAKIALLTDLNEKTYKNLTLAAGNDSFNISKSLCFLKTPKIIDSAEKREFNSKMTYNLILEPS